METSTPAVGHIDLLAKVYQLILSWPEPDKQETTDREDFGETPRSVADATELGGSARFDSNTE
jgi:hypothetical protein